MEEWGMLGGSDAVRAAMWEAGLLRVRPEAGPGDGGGDTSCEGLSREEFRATVRAMTGGFPSDRELMAKIFGPAWEPEFRGLDLCERPAEE